MQLEKSVLDGIISPPGAVVDHVFAEILFDGRWVKCDSYIVDSGLLFTYSQPIPRGVMGKYCLYSMDGFL